MSRIEEFREQQKIKKEKEIQNFLNNINVLHNNVDSVAIPSVEIMTESENCYTSFHIAKHPNMLVYGISLYKKDYPFNIYWSKNCYKNAIPQKYLKQFEELEKYFG